jgi:hypothetical protein
MKEGNLHVHPDDKEGELEEREGERIVEKLCRARHHIEV